MKRCFLLCSLLVALCALAYANQEIVNLGVAETKEGITAPMNTEEIQAEIEALSAEIMAAKAGGWEPDAALYARLAELEAIIAEPFSPSSHLDQGGETCADAVEILSLPFCDSGVMGATNDCNPTTYPYRDIFYKYTPTTTGIYRVSMCGSIGDTRLSVWDTICCGGAILGFSDDECGGLDPARDFTLTAGVTYFFEIGYYSSTQAADVYFFNLFGPEPTGVPANNLCSGAIALTIPDTELGTIRNATNDTGLPTCDGSSAYNKGVWYTIVGNGHNLTARTYNNCSSFDTRIRVLTAPSCSGPWTCIGGNNDYGTGSSLSQYTWCSDVGVTYYIIISNNSTTAGRDGPFTLEILDGSVCACDQMPYCGTPTETEPNNICPTQVDPFIIDCAETIYALHCPEADSDWFPVTVPPGTVMWLYHYDGDNCDRNPMVCARSKVYDATCVLLGGPTASGWRLTNPTTDPWNVLVLIYGYSACRSPYKIVTWCCDLVDYCANPIILPGVFTYTNTANTCCGTNVVSHVFEYICSVMPFTSGNDVVYRFTILSSANLTVTATGACDNQVMIMTVCGDTSTCVATKDSTLGGEAEVIVTTLPAGTYYVSTSCFSTGCGDITLTINSDVPLPVELTTLEAIAADREVTLRWTTASEWDNAYFEVQRKAGAAAWMTVGKVDGAGNSQTTQNYEYTDRAVVNEVTYTYRLLSHDINGAVQVYDMMAEATPGMPIPTEYALEQNHPNPFNPNTSISFAVKEAGFVTLKVYNLIGQEVATLVSKEMAVGRYTAAFTATDLPSGVYVYRLEVNDFTAQKKMVLLK